MIRWWALGISLAIPAAVLGSEWREVRGPHVVLRTDLSSKEARTAAEAMEHARARLLVLGWPGATLLTDDPIVATLFSNWSALPKSMDRNPEEDVRDVPVQFVSSGGAEQWSSATRDLARLNHALTHQLVNGIYRHPPPWFVEGMAQFMEPARRGERAGEDPRTVILGEGNPRAYQRYQRVRTTDVADVLRWDGLRAKLDQSRWWGLAGMSWMTVFWLYHVHLDALRRLLEPDRNPDREWAALRALLEAPDIDETIHRWISHASTIHVSIVRVGAWPPVTLVETPLSEAEVHATRARVLIHRSRAVDDGAELRAQAARELAAALALEPRNLTAMLLRLRMDPGAEQRLVDLDWREQNNLAVEQLQAGKATDALDSALRAAALAPFQPAALDTLAAAMAVVGRCVEAQEIEARAIVLLPPATDAPAKARPDAGADAGTLARYQERLQSYRTRCLAAGTPAAPAPDAGPRPPPGAGAPSSPPLPPPSAGK